MSWILHHTYVKWGWQCSNCNISQRMIAFSSFHCPCVFLSCSQPMVPNVFLFPCIYAPFMYLSLPFMFISCAFDFYVLSLKKKQNVSVNHIFVLRSFWCSSDFSFSVRLLFFLIFLSCPFHFTLLALQFPSLFPSSHSIFLVCPVIFQNHIEFPCIFVSNYVHGPWFFSWSSLLVYASGCQFIMW